MSEINVRIERLEPMRVAAALGFGPSPEGQAWDKLMSWAQSQGLLTEIGTHRFFGFNNPDPSPGSPNYGYEQWMTVSTAVEGNGEVKIKEIPGGLYVVARCTGVDHIYETWQQLVAWLEDSPYRQTQRQCLEECLTPQLMLPSQGEPALDKLVFDLYTPVAE